MGGQTARSEKLRKRHARERAALEAEVGVGACGVPGCTDSRCTIRCGECHCGCGVRTNLAPQSSRRQKIVLGKPYLYVVGHNLRAPVLSPLEGGRLLEEARRARGLSQLALARLSGASAPTVSRLEGGVLGRVSAEKGRAIADALGCPVAALFTEDVPAPGDRPRRRPATAPRDRYDGSAAKRASEEARQYRSGRGLLTRGEAAAQLRVDPAQVTHYSKRGLLEPAERLDVGVLRANLFRKSDVDKHERDWARTLDEDGLRNYWLDPGKYVEQMKRQGYVARFAERHGVTEEAAEATYRDRAERRHHQVYIRRRGRPPANHYAEWIEQFSRAREALAREYQERVELGLLDDAERPPAKWHAALAVAERSYAQNPELWAGYPSAATDPHALHPDFARSAAQRVLEAVKEPAKPAKRISGV